MKPQVLILVFIISVLVVGCAPIPQPCAGFEWLGSWKKYNQAEDGPQSMTLNDTCLTGDGAEYSYNVLGNFLGYTEYTIYFKPGLSADKMYQNQECHGAMSLSKYSPSILTLHCQKEKQFTDVATYTKAP